MKMKDLFWETERTGRDTQGGVIVHEASHYDAGGGTDDHEYGEVPALDLAKDDPEKARNNADNIEYYCEDL
jgi:peptidyl-Lys metalloendopeptidase